MSEKEQFNIFDPKYVYELKLANGGKRTVSHEEVLSLSLNFEHCLPELQGNKTWISNYVGTFWTHFMGPQAFAIYFQLVKMAFGDKDFAFPSVPYLAMLTGMSPRTVQRNLPTLIELEFVIALEVKDAKTNDQLNNVYLLSNTIPFLPQSYYDRLPERLKEEHREYMDKIKFRTRMQGEIELPTYQEKYKKKK